MKERLLKATPNALSTVDMIILVLKKVVNKNDTTIISTNSGRGFNVFFTINSVGYQISVDTDIDTIEFGIITDCRYLVNRECVSSAKALEVFNVIKDTYTKKELVKVFEHLYADSNN
mgnify:FL=1